MKKSATVAAFAVAYAVIFYGALKLQAWMLDLVY